MLQTSASAAAGKRVHPLHVLAGALLLCCLSLLLHGQLQVHSQLRAARQELVEIKGALAASGHATADAAVSNSIPLPSSSSSSSSSSGSAGPRSVQHLVHIIKRQQQLLNSQPRWRNKQLKHRVHQLTEEVTNLLGPILADGGNGSTAAMQHVHTLPPSSAMHTAAARGNATAVPLRCPGQQVVGNTTTNVPPGTLCLDLSEMLGLPQFVSGITWEPKTCFAGLSKVYTDPADQQHLRKSLLRDLTRTMASVRSVDIDSINTTLPWWMSLVDQPPQLPKSILSDPAFHKWQSKLAGVLARYMVRADDKTPAVPCPGAPPHWLAKGIEAMDLPMAPCAGRNDAALLQQMGRHAQPYDSLANMVNVMMNFGTCTVPDRDGFHFYGDFMMSRAMNSKWRTFKTNTLEEDTVVFLWDILYQARDVFMKQRWLGVAAMQQPFDFLAIGDIVYEVQPDVILETGTANGGSALMWASLLELNGLTNSSVITVDLQAPGAPGAFGADPPSAVMNANGQVIMMPRRRPQQNPLEHPLWSKYVTFVEGSSIDPTTITKVKGLLQQKQHQVWQSGADGAGSSQAPSSISGTNSTIGRSVGRQVSAAQRGLRVLVLLDSHHMAAHVLTEMESYCPLVSVGSFCIIEDTKLSRWTNSDPGPLASVQSFLAWHPEFAVDRDRELMFTHHPYGYLQRLY